MMVARKSDTYRHPMDSQVLDREYVSLAAYESAFVCELKSQIASHLFKALDPDDVEGNVRAIAEVLEEGAVSSPLGEELGE